MISIFRLTVFLILGSISLVYVFFWGSFLEQRRETASIMIESLRSDISEIAYTLSKSVSKSTDIQNFKAMLDRKAASNDLIDSIMIAQGSRILLGTDPSFRQVPKTEDIALDVSKLDLDSLLNKIAIADGFRFYEHDKPVQMNLLFFIDRDYVKNHIEENLTQLLYMQGIPPFVVLLVLWFMLDKTVVRPLVKLRRFAYDPETRPDSFKLKELESIRLTMDETYSRLKAERNELYRLSTTDDLSGLANRNSLNERLSWLIPETNRNNSEFALIVLDLDNFKTVNDTLGHKAGDILLKSVAAAINELIRANDIVARIGGDEFVIVLSHYKARNELVQILDRILSRIKQPWYVNNNQFFLTVSMGVAFYPLDGADAVSLLKNADIAMYEAKKNGRGRYHFFSESLNKVILDEVTLDREMRSALFNGEFELYYQPKTRIDSDKITGVEALLRWNHPVRGIISPVRFIPIAERSGFINDLGQWIIKQVISQQVDWRQRNVCDIAVSFNLSPQQLFDVNLFSGLRSAITESGVDPAKIDAEITESTFLENTEDNLKMLTQIHELGVNISLDDFGTGYSSLAYLKKFPIDTIKIDKAFVDDYGSKSGAVFLKTIVAMGKSLDMEVISEGVEQSEQLDFLKNIGCDMYQGYYCSKPLKQAEFEKLVTRKNKIYGNNVVDIGS